MFASGKDRRGPGPTAALHTNFKLKKGGGRLALVRPSGRVSAQVEYPPQSKGVSFGLPGGAATGRCAGAPP